MSVQYFLLVVLASAIGSAASSFVAAFITKVLS